MFEGFANVWTPVTLSRRLKANKPLPVVLAAEKLVFFRVAWPERSSTAARIVASRCRWGR